MNPLLRKWLDKKNLEFNHDGYSQETLNALKEFANYVAAQPTRAADGAEGCWLCGKPEREHPSADCMSFICPAANANR